MSKETLNPVYTYVQYVFAKISIKVVRLHFELKGYHTKNASFSLSLSRHRLIVIVVVV